MGFCLFRNAGGDGLYFAVNGASVLGMHSVGKSEKGEGLFLLKLERSLPTYSPVVEGPFEAIQDVLQQASKIGKRKVEAEMVSGLNSVLASPLLISNPGRIMLVHEIPAGEYTEDMALPTASYAHYLDGSKRIISLRPGIFAQRANAKGKVPMIDV